MSTVAILGDCHIGSYSKKLDPETGLNARLLDVSRSLEFVITDATRRGVDSTLFAGDMFRNSRPTPTELMLAAKALRQTAQTVVMIPGNHDLPRAANEHSAIDPLEDTGRHDGVFIESKPNLTDMGSYQLATLPYPNRAQLAAVLPEYASLSPIEADELVSAHLQSILRGLASQLDPGRPSILLAHISVDVAEAGAERGIMAGRDITIPLSSIPEEFTFAALGHIHYAQGFAHYDRPNVFYTGSTDRIGFGEEGQAKSYVVVDLEAGTWERVSIPCREYRTLEWWHVDGQGAWADDPSLPVVGAITRIRIKRPENIRPDYAELQRAVEDAGCWDFAGFVEDVERVASVRSEEINHADTLAELMGVWHESKGCPVDLAELVTAGAELEKAVA